MGYVVLIAAILAGLLVIAAALVELDVTVAAVGVIEPQKTWDVRTSIGGIIESIEVETGDTVESETIVARLDSRELEAQRDELVAELAQARIMYRQATFVSSQADRDREANLAEAERRVAQARASLLGLMVSFRLGSNVDSLVAAHEVGTHVRLDPAVVELRSATVDRARALQGSEGTTIELLDIERRRFEVNRLAATIDAIDAKLAQTVIIAPSSGVILTDRIDRLAGTYVAVGDRIAEIGGLEDWRAELTVGQQDVSRIQPGDSVRVEIEALKDELLRPVGGWITYVSPDRAIPERSNDGDRPVYRLIAALDPEPLLTLEGERPRRGFSVKAKVLIGSGTALNLLWRKVRDGAVRNGS